MRPYYDRDGITIYKQRIAALENLVLEQSLENARLRAALENLKKRKRQLEMQSLEQLSWLKEAKAVIDRLEAEAEA